MQSSTDLAWQTVLDVHTGAIVNWPLRTSHFAKETGLLFSEAGSNTLPTCYKRLALRVNLQRSSWGLVH